jgi:hypothetical protein
MGFTRRRYMHALHELVCSRMFCSRLYLQIFLESARALAANFPFYNHRAFLHRIHPGGTGAVTYYRFCPDD